MTVETLTTLIVTLCISITFHIITSIITRRPKFIVVGKISYREFNTWHKTKDFIDSELGEYQVFIYEKNEYTFITSSNYMGRIFDNQNKIDVLELGDNDDFN